MAPPAVSPQAIHQGTGRLWLYVPEPATGSRLILNTDGSPAQPTGIAAWAATTAVAVGQQIKDSNNNTEICLVAGITGAEQPATWPTTPGPGAMATKDGTAYWIFAGGPYGAYFAGASEGATTTALSPKYQDVGADQVSLPIDEIMIADAYEVDVVMKQTNLANLVNFFPPGTFSAGTDANQPSGAQNYEQITFGGIVPIQRMGVAVISPRRDVLGKFVVAHLYQAYPAEAFKLAFQREKETTYSVKFKAVADTTRNNGDYAGMVWRQV
jgi:hypothetical protein